MPGQETGGTLRQILTVAIFRSWRGSERSAAPGLPGQWQDTRETSHCQTQRGRSACNDRPRPSEEASGSVGSPHLSALAARPGPQASTAEAAGAWPGSRDFGMPCALPSWECLKSRPEWAPIARLTAASGDANSHDIIRRLAGKPGPT
jgi:hypothetical protein